MYTKEELNDLISKAIVSLSFDEESERLMEPVRYILTLGGKRLRPLMALMACNIFGDNTEDALMPALGLEVFHNFTLVHDDIMDKAAIRRNKPTIHEKWNVNQAILSGDAMVFIANNCLARTPEAHFMKVFSLFNRTALEVCTGQQIDMEFERRSLVGRDEYMRMVELKTAVLIAASLKTGAIIGGGEDREASLMYEFGRNLGLAFQIQDDILDVYSDSAIFGKSTGGDIVTNKKTYLLVKAFELANSQQSARLKEQLSLKEFDRDEKIAAVKSVYDETGAKENAESLANEYINKAFEKFSMVSVPEERKEQLFNLASGLIGRNS